MNNRKVLSLIATAILSVAVLCSCKSAEPVDFEEPVGFHTEEQVACLDDNYRNYKLYSNGTEELSAPVPILIGTAGIVTDPDKEVISKDYSVLLSTSEDLGNAIVVTGSNSCAEVYNLMLGTKYYCRIDTPGKESRVFTFSTDSRPPRNLYVEGVTNVRDLGGWSLEDGGRVKQGMIFRSSKFNADESGELLITENGIRTMTEELKVKTEIDLRSVDDNENGSLTASPLGEGVSYISIPFQSGGNILLLNKESMAELFAVLGNADNYPIVFHCSIGTDRTGAAAFLINGLLGVGKDDLYRDYLFSNFGNIGKVRTPSSIKTYYDTVDLSAGASLSEKIYNWLLGNGVAAEDLDKLKALLTE